ncbi:hypothetical protein [Pseudohalocynthiibacter sp. F2068]|uniref:hypothetical protein n=1 Tax=Pseudohalocynthiibacter sp. F2068 TaxID=2926418 RepID=UPI001FF325D3|nr:hypothetical protein [Pseudohalocynthiibacter sp. F2068]MCK0104312.1 hypothetical protein [Pseudohalocynthiibacter sp. F2068]
MENAAHTQQASLNHLTTNDYHKIPVTEKQLRFARQIAERASLVLPWEVQQDRRALSTWIDRHLQKPKKTEFSRYPSSKQVAYAERIARLKRRDVPRECFHDKTMMSRWIDSNQ